MLSVSPLQALNILPSGGVTPENLPSWWDAGASVVGMGTNLSGSDINYAPGACTCLPMLTLKGSSQYADALAQWESKGRAAALKIFEDISKRFPLAS
jgi:hypothetical protein